MLFFFFIALLMAIIMPELILIWVLVFGVGFLVEMIINDIKEEKEEQKKWEEEHGRRNDV